MDLVSCSCIHHSLGSTIDVPPSSSTSTPREWVSPSSILLLLPPLLPPLLLVFLLFAVAVIAMADDDRSAARLLLLLLLLLLPLLLRLSDRPVGPVDPSLVEGTGTMRPVLVALELDAAFLVPIAAEGRGGMVVVADRGAGRKRSWLLGPF